MAMMPIVLFIPWSGSGEKIWHQDNGYFRLTPCKILVSGTHIGRLVLCELQWSSSQGVWIALDPTDCANGW